MMQTKITRQGAARRSYFARALTRLLLAGLLLTVAVSSSFAHQQKTAVTRILFNSRTNNIEVMHRFFVHDAEHASSLIFGQQQTLMESAAAQELFSSYVMNRFAMEARLANGSKLDVELEYVGVEIDGQFIWVYQETADIVSIDGLRIVNSMLRDVWPDQTNLVNIEKVGQIYSLSFASANDVLDVNF